MLLSCQPPTTSIPGVSPGWLAGFRFPPPIWPSDLGWLSHLVPMLLKRFPWSSLPSFPSSQNYVLGWPKPDLPAGFNSLVREFASVPLWNSFSGKLINIPIPFWELEVPAWVLFLNLTLLTCHLSEALFCSWSVSISSVLPKGKKPHMWTAQWATLVSANLVLF